MLLGIDIGTSSIKAELLSAEFLTLRSARVPTPWREDGARIEMEPESLLESVLEAGLQCLGDRGEPVAAIGVTAIAESGVMLDAQGRSCAPIVAWHDKRGAEEEAEMRDAFGETMVADLTGQMIRRRLTAIKYLWLRRSLGRAAEGATWLPLTEWVVGALGGEPAAELSQWSRTGLLSIERPAVCGPVAEWAGYPVSRFGEPVLAGTPMGRATRRGLDRRLAGAVLTSAGHDHLCASLGAAATAPEVAFDSWGNGEALLRSVTRVADRPSAIAAGFTVSWHVIPDSHLVMAGLGTGLRLRETLAELEVEPEDREHLDRAAAEADPATADGPAAAWREALDRAARALGEALARIEDRWGRVEDVVGCGGWLLSEPLRRLRIAQVPRYRVAAVAQPGAAGAAVLGGVAAGMLSREEAAVRLQGVSA